MRLQTKLKYTTVAVATALSLAIIPSVNAASVTIENAGFESGDTVVVISDLLIDEDSVGIQVRYIP